MKKIKYMIGCLMIGTFFSCHNDDTQVFDQSAAERLQSRIDECQSILTSAENGWVTIYRPDKAFGYFNLWFQFNKDGTVHTLSDIPLVNAKDAGGGIFSPQPGFYKDTTTHYRVSSQHSVDLVFEDRMALHYLYSLPNREEKKFSSGAEFEFYITRATPEEIILESKTDPGKGGQKKTQMILKKAAPKDKENVEKSYAEWEKLLLQDNIISGNILYISEEKGIIFHSNDSDEIVKRILRTGEEISPGSYQIKIKGEEGKDIVCSQFIISSSTPRALIIPKGRGVVIKSAETGRVIDPAKITLLGVNKNQVGVYSVGVILIGELVGIDIRNVIVYDPAVVGTDVQGTYYDMNPDATDMDDRTPRRGKISLVEGTKSIFYATDLGFKGIFPVYFQMNGNTASVIKQNFIQYFKVKNIDLTYDPVKRQFHEVIHFIEGAEKDGTTRPDALYTYQMD